MMFINASLSQNRRAPSETNFLHSKVQGLNAKKGHIVGCKNFISDKTLRFWGSETLINVVQQLGCF